MKISNALLLSLSFISFVLIAAVPITYRYKFHHKDYKFVNPKDRFDYQHRLFNNLHYVSVKGISSCTIIPYDSLITEVQTENYSNVKIEISGDTLFMFSNSTEQNPMVRLFLPSNSQLKATNSKILLLGKQRFQSTTYYKIHLINSKLSVLPVFRDERVEQVFDSLTISGERNAKIEFAAVIDIGKLNLSDVDSLTCGNRVRFFESNIKYHGREMVSSRSKDGKMSVVAN